MALLLVALPLTRLEFPVVNGLVRASGAAERWSVKILFPLMLLGGLALPYYIESPFQDMLLGQMPQATLLQMVALVLATTVAVLVASWLHEWTCVPYAVIGAIAGSRLMTTGTLDWNFVLGSAGSWLLAPVLCLALSSLLTTIFLRFAAKNGNHLAVVDHWLLLGCVLCSLLLPLAFAWNSAPLYSFFPRLGALAPMPGLVAILLIQALLLVFLRAYLAGRADYMGATALDFGTAHTLSVILSLLCILALFSTELPRRIDLLPTPLSANSLLVAALVGNSLVRRHSTISGETVVKSAVSIVVTPVLAFLLGYCLTDLFDSPLPSFILLGLLILSAGIYAYVSYARRSSLRRQLLSSRREQVYSTQKSLTALEVRVETHEKELQEKLELKRKELVDYAVGVSEQKALMENVYEQLGRAQALPDGPEKTAALEEIRQQLRERMYFTREMNDFYARTEVLHRDFNTRLAQAYPSLTEGERRLANLLRQGFSSKYIASLMNITPKSVEISRYRLRLKLGLTRRDNLVQFIKSI